MSGRYERPALAVAIVGRGDRFHGREAKSLSGDANDKSQYRAVAREDGLGCGQGQLVTGDQLARAGRPVYEDGGPAGQLVADRGAAIGEGKTASGQVAEPVLSGKVDVIETLWRCPELGPMQQAGRKAQLRSEEHTSELQ